MSADGGTAGYLVVDNGGVHALTTAPTTVASLLTGINTVDVFFADRDTVEAGLVFNASLNLNPAPEPASPRAREHRAAGRWFHGSRFGPSPQNRLNH